MDLRFMVVTMGAWWALVALMWWFTRRLNQMERMDWIGERNNVHPFTDLADAVIAQNRARASAAAVAPCDFGALANSLARSAEALRQPVTPEPAQDPHCRRIHLDRTANLASPCDLPADHDGEHRSRHVKLPQFGEWLAR